MTTAPITSGSGEPADDVTATGPASTILGSAGGRVDEPSPAAPTAPGVEVEVEVGVEWPVVVVVEAGELEAGFDRAEAGDPVAVGRVAPGGTGRAPVGPVGRAPATVVVGDDTGSAGGAVVVVDPPPVGPGVVAQTALGGKEGRDPAPKLQAFTLPAVGWKLMAPNWL
jgi:hypothetical protein